MQFYIIEYPQPLVSWVIQITQCRLIGYLLYDSFMILWQPSVIDCILGLCYRLLITSPLYLIYVTYQCPTIIVVHFSKSTNDSMYNYYEHSSYCKWMFHIRFSDWLISEFVAVLSSSRSHGRAVRFIALSHFLPCFRRMVSSDNRAVDSY